MWLSVVTVVKDDVDGFRSSVDSLLEQDVGGIELVVIDGSHDQTEIPEVLLTKDVRYPIRYRWLAPTGIYPAMNAALDECQGEYVYFLNSGDTLYNREVLKSVKGALQTRPVWAYGRVQIVGTKGRAALTPIWDYAREQRQLFARGLFPSHQGTFVRREVLGELGGFDVKFTVAADYAVSLELSRLAEPLVLPYVIASFHEGGASTALWKASFREFHRARVEILSPSGWPAFRERWNYFQNFAKVYLYREIRPHLPFVRQ